MDNKLKQALNKAHETVKNWPEWKRNIDMSHTYKGTYGQLVEDKRTKQTENNKTLYGVLHEN